MRSERRAKRALPATVISLGVVSLLTDLSSEMIYPLLPVFLSSVLGAGAISIGLIEGLAETTSSVVKIISGRRSDRSGRRKPWLLGGYGLAGLVRPLIGLAGSWPVVLVLRLFDRIGKGMRGAPRDALIADVTPADQRGAAYGAHRTFDHVGALLGPLVAAALLSGLGWTVRQVFLAAALPAVAVMVVLWLAVREPRTAYRDPQPAPREDVASPPRLGLAAWRELGMPFHRLVTALLTFTLGNSTDAFLLLRLSQAGVGNAWVALLWSAHSAIKAVSALASGRLSDRLGRRPLVVAGWAVYAGVYLAFAMAGESRALLIAAFLIYGASFGFTEPVEKAWVVDLVPAGRRGTALGFWQGAVGLAALPASLLFGAVWSLAGAAAAFAFGAVLAVVASLLLWRVPAASAAN